MSCFRKPRLYYWRWTGPSTTDSLSTNTKYNQPSFCLPNSQHWKRAFFLCKSRLAQPVCGMPRHYCEEFAVNRVNGSGRISSSSLVSSWLSHTSYHITDVLMSNICQGKGWEVPLRMAAEVGCPRWSSSSSPDLLPTPQLAELRRGEPYNLPCNSILLSGIFQTLPEIYTAGKCMCFAVHMHEGWYMLFRLG